MKDFWLLTIAAACVSGVVLVGGDAVSDAPRSEKDNYYVARDRGAPTILVQPRRPIYGNVGNDSQVYWLYASVDRRSGTVEYGVQWSEMYMGRGWREYERASDTSGRRLDIKRLARNSHACTKAGCFYDEHYTVAISDEEIAKARKSGLDFNIHSDQGAVRAVHVPAETVRECLDRVADAQGQGTP